MRKKFLIVVAVAALLGAVLSIMSTTQHFRIQKEGLEKASFCSISETINCDVVNASSYSEFLGVPIAWWGLIYYLIVGVMALSVFFSKKDRRATASVAWFMSLGGILYSFYLGYVSFFILGVLCIECLGMYLANILITIFLFISLGIPLGGIVKFIKDYLKAMVGKDSNIGFAPKVLKHVVIVAIVFGLSWITIAQIQAAQGGGKRSVAVDELVNAYYSQSLHSIEVNPEWPVWGNPDAKVTIVEFSEYQCPFCRLAAFNVKSYLQEFKNDIRYYFVNYPLDNSCNDNMKRPMHKYACFAGKAAICAQAKGEFWSFHDELFRKQRKLSRKTILGMAKERGWNPEEFLACINSPETDARIRREVAAGRKIYISGTPTIFLDNRKVRYWRDPKFLRAVVREEIKREKK
jgi:protein-disulfide isomerase/uncharacterized membrane protein